jgi:hypothetical protein
MDNAQLSNEELRERVTKVFPNFDLADKHKFGNYRRRALEALEREKPKSKKKPAPKATKKKKKPKDSVPAPARSLEGFDPLETPDAKQLTALLLRVGLNTGEAVLARLKHVEEKQR